MNESIRNILKNAKIYHPMYYIYKLLSYKYVPSDRDFIKQYFKNQMDSEVELENPIRFSDKLQWLKLNWYDSLATKCADKYRVRKYVKNRIGEKYLNELYGIYESVDDLDINKLPTSFVLKATHGSGWIILCKDKKSKDWNAELWKMKWWLKENYYWRGREWVYKDVKPRIISEKYLDNKKKDRLIDYKFYCFNGFPKYCQVISDRNINKTIDFYDRNWNHMPFYRVNFSGKRYPHAKDSLSKPEKYDEMLKISEDLSKDFPFVRVDLYYINKKIYFGEMTFFPNGGLCPFEPSNWNYKMGNMLRLPDKLSKNA